MTKLALFLLFAAITTAQDQSGVIDGLVRDSISGTPVADLKVTLRSLGSTPAFRNQKTDVAGNFRFDNLAAGPYELSFYKVGYVDSGYFGGPVLQVRVKAGPDPSHATVNLVPTGSIEGRVLDENGKPVKGVLLYAERNNAPAILAISEEGGRYRLENLAPEQFRIEIRVPFPLRKETVRRDPDRGVIEGFPNTQFYPGVEDVRAAAMVPVASGTVQGGFDIRLKRLPLVELSGSAIDLSTKTPLAGAEVELSPAAGGLADSTYDRRSIAADGTFRFDLIRPGRYTLLFYRSKGDKDSPYSSPIEVGTSGVRDYVERVPALTRLTGKVVMPPDKAQEWGHLDVVLVNPAGGSTARHVEVAADGSFAFEGVSPGHWSVMLSPSKGSVRPWYVASVSHGNGRADKGSVTVTEGVNPPVEIVLGADAAQVSGIVQTSAGQPASGAMVLLTGAAGTVAFQAISAEGAFTISGIAPGEYLITAVPSRDASEWVGNSSKTCGSKSIKLNLAPSERRTVPMELCLN